MESRLGRYDPRNNHTRYEYPKFEERAPPVECLGLAIMASHSSRGPASIEEQQGPTKERVLVSLEQKWEKVELP